MLKTILYCFCQCTWGILQTVLGGLVFLCHLKDEHRFYHGALITTWKNPSSISLGMFIFITDNPYFYDKLKDEYSKADLSNRLLVHEYGHTIQSLILGPAYLFAMGIPSTLWGFSPTLSKKRKTKQISYFSFFTEKWANQLGEAVIGEKSMGNLVID